MMKNIGNVDDFFFYFKKFIFIGELIDLVILEFIDYYFKVFVCSMYGIIEIGVVLVNYFGVEDFQVKFGFLGKFVLGLKFEVQ